MEEVITSITMRPISKHFYLRPAREFCRVLPDSSALGGRAAWVAIGVLLVGVSAVLGNIAGEVVAGPILEELHRVLTADPRIALIDEIATMHLGPQAILIALTLRFRFLWTTQYGQLSLLCKRRQTCRISLFPAQRVRP
jgi:hypothetical protein